MENKIETMPKETAASAENEPLQRNKYADKMNPKKKKHKKLKLVIGLVALAALVAGGIYLVQKSRSSGQETAANTTAVVTRGMLETYVEGDGVTAANKRQELGKDIKGRVSEVLVSVGDKVSTGDKLLIINPTETRKELSTAQEELQEAQRGVTSAQSEVSAAQTTLNAAQKKLGSLTVTAPFTGKIVPVEAAEGAAATTYRVGQQVGEGTVIGQMVDDSVMKLPLYFSYAYIDSISAGQSATVSIPSAMSSVPGQVAAVEPVRKISDDGVAMFRAIITLKNPGTLTKGMTATATVSAGGEEVYPASSGELEYNREEDITVKVGGEIASVGGLDYYQYSSGATIMRIKSDSVQDEITTAQNSVKTAQTGVTSAQKNVQDKQARITELQKLIDNATITSPISGVVTQLNVVVDQDVDGTVAPCVVADLDSIVVNANIAMADVSGVQAGQPAAVTMYLADGEIMLTGTVSSVSMEASKDTSGAAGSMSTFPAVITLDPVEGQTIRPDTSVQYKITTAQVDDCLTVPSSAVVNTDTGTAVFAHKVEGVSFPEIIAIPEGTEGIPKDYVLVPVEIGLSDATNTEIVSGVEEGTEVYLAGPTDLNQEMNDKYAAENAEVAAG